MREAATCCAESFPGDYVQAMGDREGCEIINLTRFLTM